MRIIDKDIELWAATIEEHERQLRLAHPLGEARVRLLIATARAVLASLQAYKSVLK